MVLSWPRTFAQASDSLRMASQLFMKTMPLKLRKIAPHGTVENTLHMRAQVVVEVKACLVLTLRQGQHPIGRYFAA